ncbi:MAG: hypothetical protein QXN93_06860 [Methanomassiliicoccales archaeon]
MLFHALIDSSSHGQEGARKTGGLQGGRSGEAPSIMWFCPVRTAARPYRSL